MCTGKVLHKKCVTICAEHGFGGMAPLHSIALTVKYYPHHDYFIQKLKRTVICYGNPSLASIAKCIKDLQSIKKLQHTNC